VRTISNAVLGQGMDVPSSQYSCPFRNSTWPRCHEGRPRKDDEAVRQSPQQDQDGRSHERRLRGANQDDRWFPIDEGLKDAALSVGHVRARPNP